MWQGIKWSMPSSLLHRPCDSRGWLWMSRTLTVAFPARVVSYAWVHVIIKSSFREDEMWQGIKCARESEPHHVHRSITHDSHGWPWMSWTMTVAFPMRVLRWGYLSQGKGSLPSKLQSFLLPYHQKNERKHLELHVVSHRHGLAPGRPLILMWSLHQCETHCANANFSWG